MAFYALTRQKVDLEKTKFLFLPSASISLEIIGNYLRLKKYSLTLTEPCFDNLANIFKRHDVRLESLPDTCLGADNWDGRLDAVHTDAICIVSPNNPTGNCYTQANFEQLVQHCKKNGQLLILDTSFRAYSPDESVFDEYHILQESGIDFIVVEDTGKTWPTKELKVSMLAIPSSIYDDIYDIYTDFIYHHSPFTIRLLTEFIKHSQHDNLASIRQVVATNRAALYKALEGSPLRPTEKPYTSVSWLQLEDGYAAKKVVASLAGAGIFILPGNYFFWSDKSLGDHFVRISLVRDPATFARACAQMHQTLTHL